MDQRESTPRGMQPSSSSRGTLFDRVYYYVGGLERGEWRETQPHENETTADLVASIERQGYVAVRGSSKIGPPEGPPSRERFADVLSMNLPPTLASKVRAQILTPSHAVAAFDLSGDIISEPASMDRKNVDLFIQAMKGTVSDG